VGRARAECFQRLRAHRLRQGQAWSRRLARPIGQGDIAIGPAEGLALSAPLSATTGETRRHIRGAREWRPTAESGPPSPTWQDERQIVALGRRNVLPSRYRAASPSFAMAQGWAMAWRTSGMKRSKDRVQRGANTSIPPRGAFP